MSRCVASKSESGDQPQNATENSHKAFKFIHEMHQRASEENASSQAAKNIGRLIDFSNWSKLELIRLESTKFQASATRQLFYQENFFKDGPFPASFSLFLSFQFNLQLVEKTLLMLGFELQISGVGSDRSTN